MACELIRNFCIVAHIDHGKTTLSDRLLEMTNTISKRESQDQHLDSMDLERERGITIKAHPVTMFYQAKNGQEYRLNLVDTPGHVDFAYEVSRSLASCEGALLLVDAAQGVEAQTVANAHLAMKQNLKIIPVINKIDLPNANLDMVKKQLEDILAIPADDAVLASAKNGIGIEDILEAVIQRIPPPADWDRPDTRALVFDSVFDTYRGGVVYTRVFSGEIKAGMNIMLMSEGRKYEVKEVGVFMPKMKKADVLKAGYSGYIIPNIKSAREINIGDTITDAQKPTTDPLPGFQKIHPMVFSGIYPINTADFEQLKASMEKLSINDASFVFQPENSIALGFGFRCGFLGLLHMEIIQERLRREYNMDIISTYPSVVYKVIKTNGDELEVDNPAQMPDPSVIEEILEPYVKAYIMCPNENIGDMMQLVMEKRGDVKHTDSIDSRRVMLNCDMPLNEILVDFHDKIKSMTRGYGSMDYEHDEYRTSDLVKMDMLINGEPMDAFSCIVHRSKAEFRGRALAAKLKEVIPTQMFTVPIQAAIGGKVIARETISAMRKNVTAKCYGGDITRKRKLLEKQKEGKKKMKQFGKVNIPQEAFIQVLKTD
ncbi:translation elongation factor 4 [Kamptonema cortianum]|nr:translation elongation factor 4 [Oscillatoria laete-virens]MDK3159647.1 translation elongation factor 4 [Kamptonema cortianum]MDL5050293.1 translation elongation factor 4 [Oscillatoria amoena NRMC-F 0135]MDL5055126.1 translation elongation factor 4 [Oscillatoria laete-virens NRMC-F 0139]